MRTKIAWCGTIAGALFLAGCGGDVKDEPTKDASADAAPEANPPGPPDSAPPDRHTHDRDELGDGACPAATRKAYATPGCGASAQSICQSNTEAVCFSRTVCSCQGTTTTMCFPPSDPYAHEGPCCTEGGTDAACGEAGKVDGEAVPDDGKPDGGGCSSPLVWGNEGGTDVACRDAGRSEDAFNWDAAPPDGACPPPYRLRYRSAGCGAAAVEVCVGVETTCAWPACSCTGRTIIGCDTYTEPFAYRGPCCDSGDPFCEAGLGDGAASSDGSTDGRTID